MLKGPSDSSDSNLGPFNYYFIQIPSCDAISFQNGRSSPSDNLNFIVHLQIEGRICFKSESTNMEAILAAISKGIITNINEGN